MLYIFLFIFTGSTFKFMKRQFAFLNAKMDVLLRRNDNVNGISEDFRGDLPFTTTEELLKINELMEDPLENRKMVRSLLGSPLTIF